MLQIWRKDKKLKLRIIGNLEQVMFCLLFILNVRRLVGDFVREYDHKINTRVI